MRIVKRNAADIIDDVDNRWKAAMMEHGAGVHRSVIDAIIKQRDRYRIRRRR